MREILFRGKRIFDDDWVYGFAYKQYSAAKVEEWYIRAFETDFLVVPETVCQFTGLYDKNGRRIFEGDIVKRYYQSDVLFNIGVINWDSRNAWWACQLNTMNPCFSLYDEKQMEIIGNIYDNPEVLEGRDEIL